MKIVLDTNVLISGIFWKGVPGEILDYWTSDKIEIVVTEEILKEYIDIIQRMAPKDEDLSKHWATFLQENAEIIMSVSNIKVCRDPDDDKFINCALSIGAAYIVSGDNDLLSVISIESINIITPSGFLKNL